MIVNDESVETLIAPPYIFDLSHVMKDGENHIEIIVQITCQEVKETLFHHIFH